MMNGDNDSEKNSHHVIFAIQRIRIKCRAIDFNAREQAHSNGGLDKQPIRGESGLTCIADTTVSEINIEEIDSIVLPGCLDIEPLLEEEGLIEFLKQVVSTDTIVASISSSPYFLAKAGLLIGKKYTVGLQMEAIEMVGVFEKENYCPDLVVQDGNMITARGSGFIKFGVCLGKALNLEFNESWYQGK